MKFKTLVAVALATLAITSCDDTTDTFGNSLIDNKDALAEACPTMAALIDKTYQTINKVIEEYKKRG